MPWPAQKLDDTMAAVGSADVHLQLQFQPAEVGGWAGVGVG